MYVCKHVCTYVYTPFEEKEQSLWFGECYLIMNKRLRKICKILKYSLHLWPKERVIRRKFYGVEGFIFNPKKRIVKCTWISASWIGVYLSSGKFDAIVHDLDSLMELCTIWIVWSNCAQTLHVDDAQPSSYRERVEWGVIPHLKSTFIFL